MKNILILFVLCALTTVCVSAKALLGEYVLGFGYGTADGFGAKDNVEGDFLRLSAHGPYNSFCDLSAHLDYGSYKNHSSNVSSWDAGIDSLFRSEILGESFFRFRPYFGAGLGYVDVESGLAWATTATRSVRDGFNWSLLAGTEWLAAESVSFLLGSRFTGSWSQFDENEIAADLQVRWWFDAIHGLSFEYQREFESEYNQFTLRYLYSWQ